MPTPEQLLNRVRARDTGQKASRDGLKMNANPTGSFRDAIRQRMNQQNDTVEASRPDGRASETPTNEPQ